MEKPLHIALAALLTVLGLAVCEMLHARQTEPMIDSRPLTRWLDENDGSVEGERNAQRAVEKAGTNAVPTLLRMLRQRDSPFKCRVVELAQRLRLIRLHYMPSDRRNLEAWVAFETLGARAQGAVPALMGICDLKISMWSQLYTVKSLGAIGPAANMATLAVLRETTNSHSLVRCESLAALVRITTKPELVVPALTNALSDPNSTVRFVACNSLARLGETAKQAVPALVKSLSDPVRDVQFHASRALKAIDPEAAAKAGVK